MSYTSEIKEILDEEALSTDDTAGMLYPLIEEIMAIKSCYDRELLCEKLLIEAKLFNRLI